MSFTLLGSIFFSAMTSFRWGIIPMHLCLHHLFLQPFCPFLKLLFLNMNTCRKKANAEGNMKTLYATTPDLPPRSWWGGQPEVLLRLCNETWNSLKKIWRPFARISYLCVLFYTRRSRTCKFSFVTRNETATKTKKQNRQTTWKGHEHQSQEEAEQEISVLRRIILIYFSVEPQGER